MKLVLVRGIPGSGKSTYAKTNFPNNLILENDMFLYKDGKYVFDPVRHREGLEWCRNTCAYSLSKGMDVIVSNTFTRKDFVDQYRAIAEHYGAEFQVFRMENRFENIHNVPTDVLKSMEDGFEDYQGEVIVKASNP